MYVTLKLNDNGCRIHSVSDGNEEIVTSKTIVGLHETHSTKKGCTLVEMSMAW